VRSLSRSHRASPLASRAPPQSHRHRHRFPTLPVRCEDHEWPAHQGETLSTPKHLPLPLNQWLPPVDRSLPLNQWLPPVDRSLPLNQWLPPVDRSLPPAPDPDRLHSLPKH
jgi:hypothetical protein